MPRCSTELGLTRLGDITRAVALAGAAVILAETGDPRRYETSSRSMVKHAGLSPSDNASGASEGASRISRRRQALAARWRPGGRRSRCSATTR